MCTTADVRPELDVAENHNALVGMFFSRDLFLEKETIDSLEALIYAPVRDGLRGRFTGSD